MNEGISKQRLLEAFQLPILCLICQYKIVVIGRIKWSLFFPSLDSAVGKRLLRLCQIPLIITAASYKEYLIPISPHCHWGKHKSLPSPPGSRCCFKGASLLSPSGCCNLQDHFKRPRNGRFGWSLIINQRAFPSWNSTVNIVLTDEKLNGSVGADVKALPSYHPCSYNQNQNGENEDVNSIGCILLCVKKLGSDGHFWLLSETGFEMNQIWG